MKDLSHYRKSYEKDELNEGSVPDDPLELFAKWFDEAETSSPGQEVNAMTLSTIGADGFPKSRILLLKHYSKDGFVFFTNYNSDKGQAIAANPNVCLSFFWPSLERQVIIKGEASKTTAEISDSYFESRPKGSQLGALASAQSNEITKDQLEARLRQLEEEYKDKPVVRPEHWGGYVVKPSQIEFWQGRPNRLHDRILYKAASSGWKTARLSP